MLGPASHGIFFLRLTDMFLDHRRSPHAHLNLHPTGKDFLFFLQTYIFTCMMKGVCVCCILVWGMLNWLMHIQDVGVSKRSLVWPPFTCTCALCNYDITRTRVEAVTPTASLLDVHWVNSTKMQHFILLQKSATRKTIPILPFASQPLFCWHKIFHLLSAEKLNWEDVYFPSSSFLLKTEATLLRLMLLLFEPVCSR